MTCNKSVNVGGLFQAVFLPVSSTRPAPRRDGLLHNLSRPGPNPSPEQNFSFNNRMNKISSRNGSGRSSRGDPSNVPRISWTTRIWVSSESRPRDSRPRPTFANRPPPTPRIERESEKRTSLPAWDPPPQPQPDPSLARPS